MTMASTALPDFIAPGNEVVCVWHEPDGSTAEYPAQILQISRNYTQAQVQWTADESISVVAVTDILRVADTAESADYTWGEEPAEAEVGEEVQEEEVSSWWQGQLVAAYSTQYDGGPWPAKCLDISPDGTKLKVQFIEDGTTEIVPVEFATTTEEEEPTMPATAKTPPTVRGMRGKAPPMAKAPVAKAAPKAPAKAAASFFVGQKVSALYAGDGRKYPAVISALNTTQTQAKVVWDSDGSTSEAIDVASGISRRRGRQAGAHPAAAAPATNGGGAVDAQAQAAYLALRACKKPNLRHLAQMLNTKERGELIQLLSAQ